MTDEKQETQPNSISETATEVQTDDETFFQEALDVMKKAEDGSTPEKSNQKDYIYSIYHGAMSIKYQAPQYFFDLTDWYIGYLIRSYRSGDTTIPSVLPTVINFAIQQIGTFYPDEYVGSLLNTLMDAELFVFENYDQAVTVVETIIKLDNFSIQNWTKFLQIFNLMLTKEKIGRDEYLKKSRGVIHRMINNMKGGDREMAMESVNCLVSFEQMNGTETTLKQAMEKRKEVSDFFDEKEKRIRYKSKALKKEDDEKKPFSSNRGDKKFDMAKNYSKERKHEEKREGQNYGSGRKMRGRARLNLGL
ncbi:hypothetical protein EIN_184780 [Entamoeba invadens IP1]|uniref:hypothetical protein n=1 Tax=Entamoeba invadens IP1 TaxID=370355 RepID=UPI0002C3DA02|nr:hypothetical protein EIN_184780 [Entamoeba invadens IP1]ELP94111.1 hypothetical protein EIN_184780 [Entamoeba invadens IP1]|eukprot:XP_004260882.1 hypothetical protein EIN_184780 [Entamoeba invadens IP1]